MAEREPEEPVPTLNYARPDPPPRRARLNPTVPYEVALGILLVEVILLTWRHPGIGRLAALLAAEVLACYVIQPRRNHVRALLLAGFTIVVMGLGVLFFRLARVDEGPRPYTTAYWDTENQTYRFNVAWSTRYLWICYVGVGWLAVVGAYGVVRWLVVGKPGGNNRPSPNRSERPDG